MRKKHAPPLEPMDSPIAGERNGKVKLAQLGILAAGIIGASHFKGIPGLSIICLTGSLAVVFGVNTFRRAKEGQSIKPTRVVTASLLALFLGMGLMQFEHTKTGAGAVTRQSSALGGAMSAGAVSGSLEVGKRIGGFIVQPIKGLLDDGTEEEAG